MPQDLISLVLPVAKLTALDNALTALEAACSDLVAMDPITRKRLNRMGDKSEAFCRQTLTVMSQNPQIVAPSLGLAGAQADLLALDQLRPRSTRLKRVAERMADTETLLGGDVFAAALEGYGMLKVAGKSQGLNALQSGLSERFKPRNRRSAAKAPAAA